MIGATAYYTQHASKTEFFKFVEYNSEQAAEHARYQASIEARKDSFLANGAEKYEIVVAEDESTCERCSEMSGNVYDINEFRIGETAPPFHSSCRCTIEIYTPEVESASPADDLSEGHASSGALTDSQKQENATIIYNYLRDQGWSHNAICALLGNMDVESGINPGRQQDGGGPGFGLVQWDPSSKYLDWAKENGYEADSLIGQLEFLIYSMQPGNGEWFARSGYSDYYLPYSDFISSDASLDFLTQVFLHSYERPSVPHTDRRLAQTNYWDNILGQ